VAVWSESLELRGAGGEPVHLARTLLSHGVADLPPNTIERDGSRLETVLLAAGRAWGVTLLPDGPRAARVEISGRVPPIRARTALLAQIRHMLRLDEDLSGFYLAAAADPSLAWVAARGGWMFFSATAV
jgi:3-methyladenine DNA glycosylase/8-oxoguanine DNA glycosylase